MAYMSQDRKKEIAENLKKLLKGSGLKYSLSVRHHSTLIITITQGPIDFVQNYIDTLKALPHCQYVESVQRMEKEKPTYLDVNPYWYREHFSGKALDLLKTILGAMNVGNHDRSDVMSDYFDVGWYVDVKIGKWDKPYQMVK